MVLEVRVVRLGMVCMVLELAVHKLMMMVFLGLLVLREILDFRVFLEVRVVQQVLVLPLNNMHCMIQPVQKQKMKLIHRKHQNLLHNQLDGRYDFHQQ